MAVTDLSDWMNEIAASRTIDGTSHARCDFHDREQTEQRFHR